LIQTIEAPFLIEVNDDLDVGPRAEPVSSTLERAAKLGCIVDLSVAHEDCCPVLAYHRLKAVVGRDDGKTADGQADSRFAVDPLAIGTAMTEG
jgi:hypothetical protein